MSRHRNSSPPPPEDALPRVFAFGDFEFDEERWELRRREQLVDVPPKVMETIGRLIRNRDRVVSNEELLETLWVDVTVTEASLLKAIRIARRVLGDDGDLQRVIRTTRGRGYRFVADVEERAPRRVAPPSGFPPPAAPGDPAPREPLVGRAAELAELAAALDRADRGLGSAFLVTGELGAGKSRFAEAAAELAVSRGARVVWGRAAEEGGAPELWPWVQVLRTVVARTTSEEGHASPLEVLAAASSAEGEPPEGARFRFFDNVAGVMRRAAEDRRYVVILEDLHVADGATLQLTRFLARELAEAGVVLLGTCRPADVPDGSRQAFADLVAQVRTLPLGALSAVETAELVRALSPEPRPGDVERVHALAEGNPLFVTELARVPLPDAEGEGGRVPLPERLAGVVGRRLEGLPAATVDALRAASVVGREFELAVLSLALDRTRHELAVALEPALQRRLLVRVGARAGVYRFAHVIFRDVAYDGIPDARRAELHQRVGEALERAVAAGGEVPAALLAHHFLRATLGADVTRAARHAVAAGHQALRGFAFGEARGHFEQALEAIRFEQGADSLRVEALLGRGHSERCVGEYPRAQATFGAARALATGIGDARGVARASLGIADVRPESGFANSDVLAVLADAERALAAAAADVETAELLSRVLSRRSMAELFAGRHAAAEELASRALELARGVGQPMLTARALQARHWGLWRPGTARERLRLATELVELSRIGGDALLVTEARTCEITDLMELGARSELDRALADYARDAERSRDRNALYILRVLETMAAMLEGRFAEAERRANEALPIGFAITEENARNFWGAATSIIHLETGRALESEALFRAGLEREPDNVLLRATLARLCAEGGALDVAREELARFTAAGVRELRDDWALLPTLTHVAFAAELTGEGAVAVDVAARLAPYEGTHVVLGPGTVYLGPVSLALGAAWLAAGRARDAAEAFARAAEESRRMGAGPAEARAVLMRAAALVSGGLSRRDPEVVALGAQCRTYGEAHGMVSLARRAAATLSP